MELKVKGNINYSAQIVKIKEIHPLEGRDNVCGTMILGNHIIIGKDTKIGEVGIFFPVESKLNSDYLKYNNLYRDKLLNEDQTKKGYFELNGRIRCQKFGGHKSEGFFMPFESIFYLLGPGWLKTNAIEDYLEQSFDTINDTTICEKYIIPGNDKSQGKNKGRTPSKISTIVPEQFHFHIDTTQLGRNLHKFNLDTPISVSVKVHGTSSISSNILCRKKMSLFLKFFKLVGLPLETVYYDNVYASRKVLKSGFTINKWLDLQYLLLDCWRDIIKLKFRRSGSRFSHNIKQIFQRKITHFYSEDIWQKANEQLKPYLEKGITIYYEIVGFLSDNSYIQKGYDYSCDPGKFDTYVYRVSYTNTDGKVYEFSSDQVQMWCKQRGLKPVIEVYKGTVRNLIEQFISTVTNIPKEYIIKEDDWQNDFLQVLRDCFGLEKDCYICKNRVPFEGIVVRKLDTLDFEAYKLKSFLFLERESKELDKGQTNIEDNQEVEENIN